MIRRRLSGALTALAFLALPVVEARAEAPVASSEERLQKQIEAQQADLNEQETRLRDLDKKLKEVIAKQKESDKAPSPPAPNAAPAAPSSLDALLPEFLRGLVLSGYVQAQYESHQDSQDSLRQGGDLLNQDRFLLRRARLKVQKDWQYASTMLEFDGNTVKGPSLGFQHAEASLLYRGNRAFSELPILKLTFGLMDTPFGHELVESPKTRWFFERSQISRALFPAEPDLGARLSTALGWFRASVAVVNGEPLGVKTGYPLRDPNGSKDIVARVGADFNALPALSIAGGVSVYNGKGFHPGSSATKGALQWRDLNEDGFIQTLELTSLPGTATVPSQTFNRWAVGGDLRLDLRTPLGQTEGSFEVVVANNMDRGLFIADPILTGIDSRELGFKVGLTQEIFGYGVVGFRFDSYNPNADALDRQGGKLLPTSQTVRTFSPIVGIALPDRARLLFQYDVVRDSLGRDALGMPTDLRNDTWTLRMQVNL